VCPGSRSTPWPWPRLGRGVRVPRPLGRTQCRLASRSGWPRSPPSGGDVHHERHCGGRAPRGGDRSPPRPGASHRVQPPTDRPSFHHVVPPRRLTSTNPIPTRPAVLRAGGGEAGHRGGLAPVGRRAVAEAEAGPIGPGPVHLNLAFADPLVGVPGPLPAGRTDRRPISSVRPLMAGRARPSGVASLARSARIVWPGKDVDPGRRRAGPGRADSVGPVLADPRSGAGSIIGWLSPPPTRSCVPPLSAAPCNPRWSSCSARPGRPRRWPGSFAEVAGDAEVVAVRSVWRWRDPEHTVGVVHLADPGVWVAAALARAPDPATKRGLAEPVADGRTGGPAGHRCRAGRRRSGPWRGAERAGTRPAPSQGAPAGYPGGRVVVDAGAPPRVVSPRRWPRRRRCCPTEGPTG